ncbi:hypothetical protein C8R47DRAFT_1081262 [Mycena vitilis]|nr:hypothetical protein C8R47DRAFT_1081262 [Mycena vitilis]
MAPAAARAASASVPCACALVSSGPAPPQSRSVYSVRDTRTTSSHHPGTQAASSLHRDLSWGSIPRSSRTISNARAPSIHFVSVEFAQLPFQAAPDALLVPVPAPGRLLYSASSLSHLLASKISTSLAGKYRARRGKCTFVLGHPSRSRVDPSSALAAEQPEPRALPTHPPFRIQRTPPPVRDDSKYIHTSFSRRPVAYPNL